MLGLFVSLSSGTSRKAMVRAPSTPEAAIHDSPEPSTRADPIRAEDIGRENDRLLRRCNFLEHGRVGLVTITQDRDGITPGQANSGDPVADVCDGADMRTVQANRICWPRTCQIGERARPFDLRGASGDPIDSEGQVNCTADIR